MKKRDEWCVVTDEQGTILWVSNYFGYHGPLLSTRLEGESNPRGHVYTVDSKIMPQVSVPVADYRVIYTWF